MVVTERREGILELEEKDIQRGVGFWSKKRNQLRVKNEESLKGNEGRPFWELVRAEKMCEIERVNQ